MLLLIEANKLLLLVSIEEIEDLQSQNNAKDLFYPTTIIVNIYRDLVSRELVGFHRCLVDVKITKSLYFDNTKKKNKFQPLPYY